MMRTSNGAVFAYQSGFGNFFSTEALAGALPAHNSPQTCPFGLYAEQFSATAFTAPRASNRRSWLYRIRPAATHGKFQPVAHEGIDTALWAATPDQLRWDPPALPSTATDFIDGLVTVTAAGDVEAHSGARMYWYAANRSMTQRAFYNADGELLLIPQLGRLQLVTELGRLQIEPQEIAVIPRGLRFRVELLESQARGYVCENFGAALRLPDLGPIGSNGLACERDFLTPVAWYEDVEQPQELVAKFLGRLWRAPMDHSPFDVVAWRGNCAPYKYDLRRFNTMGSISYDHPDPSIFLVLQSVSDTPGVDNIDFVIFPPRWLTMTDTFRPPWYHRNVASEFMGLIHGVYDAKVGGFVPGGSSLHNCMSAHGPDAASYERAVRTDTSQPEHIVDTMAFMVETRGIMRPTALAMQGPGLQSDYVDCWRDLKRHFRAQ